MDYMIQDSDIRLLKMTAVAESDIKHCMKVAEKALEIAKRTGAELDMETIGRGALFHDLGKAITHDIEHGRIGALIGKKLGLPEKITDVMEKHIRGGLTEDEAKELGLPVKDYSLKTLEEKIVIYADRLVDIIMDGIVAIGSELDAETGFVEILTNNLRYGKNEKTLNRYLSYHKEIQGQINRG